MTRAERTHKIIMDAVAAGDVASLLWLDNHLCACRGAQDDESQCACIMDRRQLRTTVSLPALKRGEIKLLKPM